MTKYLKKFNLHEEYLSYRDSDNYKKPNVSVCTDNLDIHYNYIDYSKEYLTFEALEDCTFTLNSHYISGPTAIISREYRENFSYSIDNGQTWITYNTPTNGIGGNNTIFTTEIIHTGQKIIWKGIGKSNRQQGVYIYFNASGAFNIYGNIMSLLYGDDFMNKTIFPSDSTYTLCYFFYNNINLLNARNLILPATTLAQGCYNSMFYGCTSLTTAPELPATTLANSCYSLMFQDCSNLNYIKAMFTTKPSTTYTNNWVNGVASSGTFVKNSTATWNVTGINGVPEGWTVETVSE